MAEVIKMPRMSDTMEEGVIVSWLKKVGDKVKTGDILAEVETDKATMELENYVDGQLLYVGIKEGESVQVNGIIAIIGKEGEDFEALLKADTGPKKADEIDPKSEEKEEPAIKEVEIPKQEDEPKVEVQAENTDTKETEAAHGNDRLKISPLAKKIADEKGIDVHQVKGTGDHGRIVRRDIEAYQPEQVGNVEKENKATQLPVVAGTEQFEDVPLSQMRKTIARRLSESMFTAPHFYLNIEVEMSRAIAARKSINDLLGTKISFNDIVIKAVSAALMRHPKVNSSWLGDKIRYNKHINIGVAMAVEDGLIVPVVRFANSKGLSHISAEVKDFSEKAKSKKLQPSDWEGNTFTISNLGMFGIEEFTAIINPPDSCILAVGAIQEKPIVKDGQVVPGNLMKLTLSCDHRVVDGATGAQFLQTLKAMLEEPVTILA